MEANKLIKKGTIFKEKPLIKVDDYSNSDDLTFSE